MAQFENHPDGSENREQQGKPEALSSQMPDVDSGAQVVGSGLHHLQEAPQKLPEAPDEVPTPYAQLDVIVKLGKQMYDYAPTGKSGEMWQAYLRCVDTFRQSGGLPPIKEISGRWSFPITDAMARGDTTTMMKLFAEEKESNDAPKKFWAKVKRLPGINFIAGTGAGAAELGHGIFTIANEGRKYYGIGASEEEQAKAREVMAAVGESLKDIDGLVAGFLRKDEYIAAMEGGGEEVGYVLGKHYFDLALILTGAGAAKEAMAKGAHATAKVVEEAAHTAAQAAKKAAAKAGEVTAQVAEHEGVREIAATSAVAALSMRGAEAVKDGMRVAVERAGPVAKHAAKEGAKEAPKEYVKEVAKHSSHKTDEVNGDGHGTH